MNTTGAVLSRDEIIAAAERIDPLPGSVTRLLELSNSDDAGVSDVAEVIRYDPALTVDLLKRVNSAMSSARYNITDVSEAVSRLGTSQVLIMAMKRAMQGRMSASIPAYGLGANALWHHSLATAIAAEVIVHQSPIRIPTIAPTAALLHEVGMLVLADLIAPSVLQFLCTSSAETGRPLFEVEREVLGADHAEIGAAALRAWGLPMSVQIAVTRHHDAADNADVLTHTVSAADALAHALPEHCGLGETVPLDARAERSLQYAGIRSRRIPTVLEHVEQRFMEVLGTYT